MKKSDAALLALLLDLADGLPEKNYELFTASYRTAEELLLAVREGDKTFYQAAGDLAAYLKLRFTRERLNGALNGLAQKNIGFLAPCEKEFPESLANENGCPRILYYKGDLAALSAPMIGMVGTRQCSSAGIAAAEAFASAFAGSGVTVVSGMADGIDAACHRSAMRAGGRTVGVLGQGLDHVYPPGSLQLYRETVETGGLLLSEKRPDLTPKPWFFPERNRIIAGLCRAVVVVEAKANSGAIITAERARDCGVPVFVLPGSVLSASAAGSNRYLAENPGSIALSPEEVLESIGIFVKPEKKEERGKDDAVHAELGDEDEAILAAIRQGVVTFDELLAVLKTDAAKLNEKLGMLAILGVIRKTAGNEYHI